MSTRKTAVGIIVLILVPVVAWAATWIQQEITLTTDAVQQVTLRGFATILKPAIRVGNQIFMGVAAPTEDIATDDCYQFYFLQAGQTIPDDAIEFVSVVVGVGDTRGYLWRGQMLHSGPCVGAGPKIPG